MQAAPKVALVTGASSGFGQATAARLSAQGFRVFGTSRAPAHNEASSVELLPLDVNSETSVSLCCFARSVPLLRDEHGSGGA